MSKKKRLRVYYGAGYGGVAESTPWHLWIDGTSIYLLNFALAGLKVSLHGDDPRHPNGRQFHIRPDRMGDEAPVQPSHDVPSSRRRVAGHASSQVNRLTSGRLLSASE